MHILLICNEFPPARHGGIGVTRYELAHTLKSQGARVTVLGIYPDIDSSKTSLENSIQVIRLKSSRIPKIRALLDAYHLTKEISEIHRSDSISLIDGPELSYALLGKLPPIPLVIRMHGGHHFFRTLLGMKKRKLTSLLEKRSFDRADSFCAVSEFVAIETQKLLGIEDRQVEIIPNSVNTDLFSPQPEIQPQKGLIVFVGTLTKKKGLIELIQAMPMVRKVVDTAHLWIIGRDTIDDETRKSFRSKLESIIDPSCYDHIRFIEPVSNDQLPLHLAQAEVCAFPSHMESFGRVYIESMAMEKAVVAPNIGPSIHIIQDGITGLLCDPFDPRSIAAQIVKALSNPELRKRLGTQARKWVIENYSNEVLIEKNVRFYESTISNFQNKL